MATNILDAELGEYAGLGFELQEYADHIIELRFKGSLVAMFTQSVTVENLRRVCREYLDGLNGELNGN